MISLNNPLPSGSGLFRLVCSQFMEQDALQQSVFGDLGPTYIPYLSGFARELRGYKYSWMGLEEYDALMRSNPVKGRYIYCFELLQRIHLAAATSILRSERWTRGILSAYDTSNFFAFCACYRGFLEHSADSWYTLRTVVPTLAPNAGALHKGLSNSPEHVFYNFEEFENLLIHYSHARSAKKKDELAFDSHQAEKAARYLTALADNNADLDRKIKQCYAELCAIVHPADRSVLAFLGTPDEGKSFELFNDVDRELADHFCKTYKDILFPVFNGAFYVGIAALKALNVMQVPELQTPLADTLRLSNKHEAELASIAKVFTSRYSS